MASILPFSSEAETSSKLTMVVGTYNEPGTSGLYSLEFDTATAEATVLDSCAVDNPSFFTFSADDTKIYCISELAENNSYATTIEYDDGNFTPLNTVPLSGSPCYITANDRMAIVANYGGGTIDVISLDDDKKLAQLTQTFRGETGTANQRQTLPHIHCVRLSPDGKRAYASDFSGDRIMHFNINEDSTLSLLSDATTLPLETGTRHLTFDPKGNFAYLIGELSGDITVMKIQGNDLEIIQTVEADPVHEQASADIHITPDGKHLYASNRRKNDGLAIFSIHPLTGQLTYIGYQNTGSHPRNFAISPDGQYIFVACRDDNTIEIYRRDENNGLLTLVNKIQGINKPVCVKFILPNNK